MAWNFRTIETGPRAAGTKCTTYVVIMSMHCSQGNEQCIWHSFCELQASCLTKITGQMLYLPTATLCTQLQLRCCNTVTNTEFKQSTQLLLQKAGIKKKLPFFDTNNIDSHARMWSKDLTLA